MFRYPIDFWGFLRTANKPKKLEPWRVEYKEFYPNLPIFLPSKATEQKIILKKGQPDHSGVSVYTAVYPFPACGKAGVRPALSCKMEHGKAPLQARESLYPGTCFVGRAWQLQGWLDEDEQTIKTLGVRVAAQGEYAVRQTFDGTVSYRVEGLPGGQLEGFRRICPYPQIRRLYRLYPLAGSRSEEQSAQKAKLEALSAMVQVSRWKEPESEAAKVQKYKLSQAD